MPGSGAPRGAHVCAHAHARTRTRACGTPASSGRLYQTCASPRRQRSALDGDRRWWPDALACVCVWGGGLGPAGQCHQRTVASLSQGRHSPRAEVIPTTGNPGSQSEGIAEAHGAPRFLSFQKPPAPLPFELPALYRTEDYFPAAAGQAALRTPGPRRRRV